MSSESRTKIALYNKENLHFFFQIFQFFLKSVTLNVVKPSEPEKPILV